MLEENHKSLRESHLGQATAAAIHSLEAAFLVVLVVAVVVVVAGTCLVSFFFLFKGLIYLFDRQSQRGQEKGDFLPLSSLSKWPQMLELGQSKAKSQKKLLILLHGCRVQALEPSLLFS